MVTVSPTGIYYRAAGEAQSTVEAQALAVANSVNAAIGLVPIVPTSVAVGSGSGSANSNGLVTVTAANSVALNGVFSSLYRYYRVVMSLRNTANNTQALMLRLRASGTDVTTNYIYQGPDGYVNTNSNANGSTAGWNTSFYLVGYVAPTSGSGTIDIMEPFLTVSTGFHSTNQALNSATGACYMRLVQGEHSITSSYDGFTIFPNGDSFTGTVQVYGYR